MTKRERFWNLQHRAAPYLFVAPFIILFCIFMLWPLGRSVVLSLYKSAGPRSRQFIGLGHYAFFLKDVIFWLAVLNTFIYTILFIAIQIPASLGLALLLNSKRLRFRNLFRFAFFSTHLVGSVFVSIIFILLLAQRHGALDRSLSLIRSSWAEINWLGDPIFARLAIIIASLWLSVGWGMIFFLAALQSVDKELYEAASIDGAGPWSRFFNVTLPQIRPVLIFLILVGTIGAFQLFELPYILFQGAGPNRAGLTIVVYLFENGFEIGDIGAACAIGWLLMAMILGVSIVQIRLSGAAREDA